MWLTAVTASMLAAILLHAALTRLAAGRNVVALFLVGGVVAGSGLIAYAWTRYGIASIELVSAILVYGAFCELYLFLFTLALSSISANILVRLWGGPKSRAELDGLYETSAMVGQRLERMRASGLIAGDSSALRVTPRGTLIVRSYRLLRRLFRHAGG